MMMDEETEVAVLKRDDAQDRKSSWHIDSAGRPVSSRFHVTILAYILVYRPYHRRIIGILLVHP